MMGTQRIVRAGRPFCMVLERAQVAVHLSKPHKSPRGRLALMETASADDSASVLPVCGDKRGCDVGCCEERRRVRVGRSGCTEPPAFLLHVSINPKLL